MNGKTIYVCCCVFQGEGTAHVQVFDNPKSAIECDTKAVSNHCDWHVILTQNIHNKVEHDDGLPISMWNEHDKEQLLTHK